MLEKELAFERDAFFFLNGSDSSYLDSFMWLYSGKVVWLPLAVFIMTVLIYKKNWREYLLIFLSIALVITLCDQFASNVCKPFFSRLRPTHHPDFMDQVKIVFDYRGGKYGFISSHAANAFGFATFMSLLFRYKFFTCSIFTWSILTAYTRIYLGVHFISDIISGMLTGLFLGYLVYIVYRYIRKKVKIETCTKSSTRLIYSLNNKRLITYSIWICIILLIIFTKPLISLLH
ncbi:MAG: phosphatase PAP2 family protein [Porphyromonadaceae bacterium]|nr:phosphatase PAP2 family protein [Porphyromonadaceae bacterium]